MVQNNQGSKKVSSSRPSCGASSLSSYYPTPRSASDSCVAICSTGENLDSGLVLGIVIMVMTWRHLAPAIQD